MIMMLPFLTCAIAMWYGMMGMRRPSVVFWLLSLGLFIAWCSVHMSTFLALSL